MAWFQKKKALSQPDDRNYTPEVNAALQYLNSTFSTLLPRNGLFHRKFNYIDTCQYGEYTRYHFYKGSTKDLIYVVLSDDERKKIIQQFEEVFSDFGEELTYLVSLKGTYVSKEVRHYFYSPLGWHTVSMTDDGKFKIWYMFLYEGKLDV